MNYKKKIQNLLWFPFCVLPLLFGCTHSKLCFRGVFLGTDKTVFIERIEEQGFILKNSQDSRYPSYIGPLFPEDMTSPKACIDIYSKNEKVYLVNLTGPTLFEQLTTPLLEADGISRILTNYKKKYGPPRIDFTTKCTSDNEVRINLGDSITTLSYNDIFPISRLDDGLYKFFWKIDETASISFLLSIGEVETLPWGEKESKLIPRAYKINVQYRDLKYN